MIFGELLLLLTGNVGQQFLGTRGFPTELIFLIAITPALLSCIVLIPRVKNEEAMLEEAFGGAWLKYTGDVPWRLVPLLY